MALTQKQLKESLALFGPEVETWPEDIRPWGIQARQIPEMAALIKEQQRFEAALQTRAVEPARGDLAEHIISVALASRARRQQAGEKTSWIQELQGLWAFPSPAFAMVATVLIGFIIGATVPDAPGTQTAPTNTAMQIYFDNNGAIL